MLKSFIPAISLLMLLSCKSSVEHNDAALISSEVKVIKVDSSVATVTIDEYALISTGGADRRKDAAEIIALKHKWPLVMQSPNVLGFDTILSKNFTFYGEGRLLNRADYIKDRLSPSDWIITHVKYDNLTLQFFDSTALLTYRNRVTNKNVKTGEEEIEYISWADVYVKENTRWKIGASHTVDLRIEPVIKGKDSDK